MLGPQNGRCAGERRGTESIRFRVIVTYVTMMGHQRGTWCVSGSTQRVLDGHVQWRPDQMRTAFFGKIAEARIGRALRASKTS